MTIDPAIDLRAMVREVLSEAMAAPPVRQAITIRDNGDLQAFIARLVAPGAIEAVRSGAMQFSLTTSTSASPPGAAVLDGVVSERKLAKFQDGATVKLAASAVLTPMAKDAARKLGLKFERIAR